MSSKGILIDTWTYVHKAVTEQADDLDEEKLPPSVEERKVEIKVRLLKKTGNAEKPPYPTEDVSFLVECKDPRILVEGTDIEAIRKAVFAELDDALKIRWESYLLVKVERPHIYDGIGSGVQVAWTSVSKGTAWDGTELLREYNVWGRSQDTYRISPWPGVFTDKNGRVMACIPATKVNQEAMEEFARRLDGLRKLMADFLAPANIKQTLANLSGVSFLPGPAAATDAEQD